MLNRLYLLPLLCATIILMFPNKSFCKDPNPSLIVPAVVGTTLGGLVGYGINLLCQKSFKEENEKKQKFLEDLQGYISKDEYLNNLSNDRMFAHYYNGLSQLVQTTQKSEVSYLEDFSLCKSKEAQEQLLTKLKAFAKTIKKSHENRMLWSKVIATFNGALLGFIFTMEHYLDNGYHSTYIVPVYSYSGRSGSIFAPR